MNGVKGTGKSVTAEQICNLFLENHNMPVILINQRMNGLIEFLASIEQDIVVFVDEYEKVFVNENGGRNNASEILTLMDGALKSTHRRVFVFTTNNKYIDENLLERPGRIRYVKEFSDLEKEVIEELVEDLLVNKTRKESCINFISRLQKITIDIVKALITEVNIHDEDPETFADIFNVKRTDDYYNIYEGRLTEKDLLTVFPKYSKIHSRNIAFMQDLSKIQDFIDAEYDIHINNNYLGEILSFKNNVLTCSIEDPENKDKYIEKEYTFEKAVVYHSSYAF
jgi:DNA-directed RNA polymerase subunit F